MSVYTFFDSYPCLVPIREQVARNFCSGKPGSLRDLHYGGLNESPFLYIGNVMNKQQLLEACLIFCSRYPETKVAFCEVHAKGIRNLLIHVGFIATFVPNDDRLGIRFLGDRKAINNLVSKFAPLVEREAKRKLKLCPTLDSSLSLSLSQSLERLQECSFTTQFRAEAEGAD